MTGADDSEALRQRLKAEAGAAFRSGNLTGALRAMQGYVLAFPGEQPGYANLLAVARRLSSPLPFLSAAGHQALILAPSEPGPLLSLLQAFRDARAPLPVALARLCRKPDLFGEALALALADYRHGLGEAEPAEDILRQAMLLEPHSAALPLRAGLQTQETAPGRAIRYFSQVICAATAGGPQKFEALNHKAALRHAAGHLLEANQLYRAALDLSPADDMVRVNRAAVLVDCGEAVEAERELKRVLVSTPAQRDGLWLSSCLRIGKGDRTGGYRAHHVRWTDPHPGSRAELFASLPLWNGESVEGKRILVWGDFGIGDEIIFAPLAAWLAGQGAKVVLETDPRLVALLARSYPEISVIARTPGERGGGDVDAHIPSALLARFYESAASRVPLKPFVADPDRVAECRSRMDADWNGPHIGFAWGGGNKRTSWSKTTDLAEWAPLLTLPDAGFVNLQYLGTGNEPLPGNLLDAPLQDIRNDLEGLAALIDALDATVSISGINAHMAGALRKPGFILMPRLPLWFWGREGERSDWYPTLRLFRREDAGWAPPIAALAEAVRRFLSP